MQDVSRLAGCHPSTVSLALRGDSRISPETRERVRQAAAELDYVIHPFVSALTGARRMSRSVSRSVSLIYLDCLPSGYRWRDDSRYNVIYEGAKKMAEEKGYSLEVIRLADYGNDVSRLNLVLSTRNVQGIVVGPSLEHHEIEGIDWDAYAVVAIGHGLQSPVVHRVAEDDCLGVQMAFEACLELGYRRIALGFTGPHAKKRRELWMGAFLCEQQKSLAESERIPVFQADGFADSVTLSLWVDRHEPEILLSDEPDCWSQIGVPAMGIALTRSQSRVGVVENDHGIGRAAAELLIGLVVRNERGLPSMRQTLLVEPTMESTSSLAQRMEVSSDCSAISA